MNKPVRSLLPPLLAMLLAACGGGDEYEGFDASLASNEPDEFLRFFNDQRGQLDANELTRAYYAAVDPNDARATLQSYIALHGLDDPCSDQAFPEVIDHHTSKTLVVG